jgi:hypothetical protein
VVFFALGHFLCLILNTFSPLQKRGDFSSSAPIPMRHFLKSTLLSFQTFFVVVHFAFSQNDTIQNREKQFKGFSIQLFPAKSGVRGTGVNLDDLEAFNKGNIKTFDFKNQYKRVYLGADFFEAAQKEKGCDSLKKWVGKDKKLFTPISDGMKFNRSLFSKIEDLEGVYKFKNSKFLPGIVPNVDVYVKIEVYKHAKSEGKNCLIVKFLIPEQEGTQIVNKTYILKNDGVLVLLTEGNEPDFTIQKDFFQYAIYPLNDPNDATHLVGKNFHVMGSFANQAMCKNMNGLLFAMDKNGGNSGCIFFRKVPAEIAPGF